MFKVIKCLTSDKNRLTQVVGFAGIGKSSLVRNAIHYVNDRRYFVGGIIFLQTKSVRLICFF